VQLVGVGVMPGVGAGVGTGPPGGVGVGLGVGVPEGDGDAGVGVSVVEAVSLLPQPPQAVSSAVANAIDEAILFDLESFILSLLRLITNKPYMRFVVSVIFENMAVLEQNNHGLGGICVVRGR
jgi:hypothetical protein